VILYTIEGGGHTWPGGKHLAEWIAGRTTDEIKATSVMWDFFVQHPRVAKCGKAGAATLGHMRLCSGHRFKAARLSAPRNLNWAGF
jgi:hypothetical protein